MISIHSTGVVYRNPEPHLYAKHTWHPSLAHLGGERYLCGFDIGQGAESMDYRTYVARSDDGGATWSAPTRLIPEDTLRPSTHTARLAKVSTGEVVAMGVRMWRDNPRVGLTNRENIGYVPSDVILVRSRDDGKTWSRPETTAPPIIGPCWETCHAVVELRDGRWLWPTSTWRGWNGEQPNGMAKCVAWVSPDQGRTWPTALTLSDRCAEGVFSWENSLVQLQDGRLLSITWQFNEKSGQSEPNRYSISNDGVTFTAPRPNGLQGETAKMLALPGGRVLTLYRRKDKPGLWANVHRMEGDAWVNLAEELVWAGPASGMVGQRAKADELSALRFGFPTLRPHPSGDALACFWCMEDNIQNIRWVRIKIA